MRPVSLLLLVDNFHAGAPRIRRMVRRSALTHRAGPLDWGDPRRTHGRQKEAKGDKEAKGEAKGEGGKRRRQKGTFYFFPTWPPSSNRPLFPRQAASDRGTQPRSQAANFSRH